MLTTHFGLQAMVKLGKQGKSCVSFSSYPILLDLTGDFVCIKLKISERRLRHTSGRRAGRSSTNKFLFDEEAMIDLESPKEGGHDSCIITTVLIAISRVMVFDLGVWTSFRMFLL